MDGPIQYFLGDQGLVCTYMVEGCPEDPAPDSHVWCEKPAVMVYVRDPWMTESEDMRCADHLDKALSHQPPDWWTGYTREEFLVRQVMEP